MKSKERLQELAALHAAGALDGEDAAEFNTLASAKDPGLLAEMATFNRVTSALVQTPPAVTPPPALRGRILEALKPKSDPPPGQPPGTDSENAEMLKSGFSFLKHNADEGWIPLPVKGAYVKPLRIEAETGYAMVLGKLDPGTHYPSHAHHGPEQIFMISGDLHVGDQVLGPGDFHHAAPSTHHGINHSVHGCVILLVLSIEDLQAQLA